jgi:hypothetical protein
MTPEQRAQAALSHPRRGERFFDLLTEHLDDEQKADIYDAIRDGRHDLAGRLLRQNAAVWRAMEIWHDDRAKDLQGDDK